MTQIQNTVYPFTLWLDPQGYGDAPPSLTITPSWCSFTDEGGPKKAEATVSGPENALWPVLTWIGRKGHVVNQYGDIIWSGKVTGVDLTIAGYTVGLTYDSMFNRVRVLYTYDGPDGSPLTGITDWADETLSQGVHGVKEYLYSMSDAYQIDAEDKAQRILTEFSTPKGIPSTGNTKPGAIISLTGLFDLMDWVYYENLTGRIEHAVSADVAVPLGWSITGTGINFAAGRIHDIEGRLTDIVAGDRLSIFNSQNNNGIFTIDDGTNASYVDVTRTSIYAEAADDLREQDLAQSFITDGFVAGEVIELIDWVTYDGFYLTEGSTETYRIDIEVSWNGGFAYEENLQEDDPVRVRQGNSVGASGLTLEVTDGTSTTVTAHGVQIAQKFTAPGTWDLGRVSIPMQKIGSPVDSVRVTIYSDSSDDIGSSLGSAFVAAADVPTEMQKVWVDFTTVIPLTSGTPYWIVVDRNGANDDDDFFKIGMTSITYSGGRCMISDGTAYYNRTDVSLAFLVYAVQDTAAQITEILSGDAGQFFSKVVVRDGTTGVLINQYQDGRTRAGTIVRDLLRRGVDGGQRLIAKVLQDDTLIIEQEPIPDEADSKQITASGLILQPSGGMMPRGSLPVGEWVVLSDLPAGDEAAYVGEISPMYIAEGEIDLTSDAPPRLTPRVLGINQRLLDA